MTAYKRIRVLFPDHLGLPRGKYIPGHAVKRDVRHCLTLFSLTFERVMVSAPGTKLWEGLPDLEVRFSPDEIRPSWEANTGVVIGDLYYRDEPLALSPRHALRRAITEWAKIGHRPKLGIELEAYVLQPDGSGGWAEWHTPGAYGYGTGPMVDPIGLFDEVMELGDRCGLPIEAINSEYDSPQFELTLEYGEALQTVDNIFLFKLMAREIAAKHGLLLTFLGKPFEGRSGSGFHTNFSLQDEAGRNSLADPQTPDGLSPLAHQCIAGILAHHEGMTALCASTVNAYKRLRPRQLAGYWANWGYDHRGVTLRVPDGRGPATRLEHRMSDGAANPYLATAAILQAARLGVMHNLTPPPAEELDCLENQSTNRHTPDDLNQALNALEADTALVEAVGADLIASFVAVKRAEWEKFVSAVTDWERNHYLPFL